MAVEFGMYTMEQMQKKMAPTEGDGVSAYQRSQEHIAAAELAICDGDGESAKEHWRQAAILQRDFVQKLPPEKPITRSVFGESAAILFERAGDHTEAAETRKLKSIDGRKVAAQ